MSRELNVFGDALECCCSAPITGFYRDGFCRVGPDDMGVHAVCAVMTDPFLRFSKARGNDLSTPRPAFDFPGLSAGDRWCLCAARWAEAHAEGVAPRVVLKATSQSALEIVAFAHLKRYAIDLS